MGKFPIVIFLSAYIAVVVSAQDNSTSTTAGEVIEGKNICGGDGCFCDVAISPSPILCQGMSLQLMYEQSEWLATFEALNISSNHTLDVRFDENSITDVPVFPPLPIVMLSLRRNLISTIEPSAFSELKQLDYLDLSHNNLTGHALREAVFYGQYNESQGYFALPLKHLNLSHNRIHSLDKNAFDHLINLHTLDLSHNPLKTLQGSTSIAISSLIHLEFMSLAHTQVSSMHEGMLHGLMFLTGLDLSGNEFVKVPDELSFAQALQVLNLDKNKFETLDKDSFLGLNLLEDLSLRNNEKLKSVEEGTFGGLKNLTKLDLSFCKRLETLSDGAFDGLVEKEHLDYWPLKDIRLNDNGLSQIEEGLAAWDYVDYIDIQNNPFRCDCNLEWMAKVLVQKIDRIRPSLASGINCAQPKQMRGKSLKDLMLEPDLFSKCRDSKDQLFPEEISIIQSSSYRAAGITIIVIGVLMIVTGIAALGFVILKRRAIANALVNHQEIRYERADSDDDGIGSVNSTSHKSKRPNAF